MTHKSEDYKISAVKYYLKNKDNIRKTCKIFDCKKSTLQRWIQVLQFINQINYYLRISNDKMCNS
jgi:transposase-like protein